VARRSWSEEERKKALRAFCHAHPDWNVSSNQKRCPECVKKYPHRRFGLNFCREHHFANKEWLASEQGYAMIAVMAVRDQRLKEELKAEGLWYGAD